MRRRALLAAVGTGCVAFGGCLEDDATDTDDERTDSDTGSDPTETVDSRGEIAVRIDNQRDSTSTVTVTVTAETTTVFEETVEVAAGESTTLDPGLDETGGGYELIAETDDGRRDMFPFSIEEYDLQNRSKLLVWINEDRLETGMQE